MRTPIGPLTCTNVLPGLWMKKKFNVISFTFRTYGRHMGSPLAHPGVPAAPNAYPQPHPSYPPIGAAGP